MRFELPGKRQTTGAPVAERQQRTDRPERGSFLGAVLLAAVEAACHRHDVRQPPAVVEHGDVRITDPQDHRLAVNVDALPVAAAELQTGWRQAQAELAQQEQLPPSVLMAGEPTFQSSIQGDDQVADYTLGAAYHPQLRTWVDLLRSMPDARAFQGGAFAVRYRGITVRHARKTTAGEARRYQLQEQTRHVTLLTAMPTMDTEALGPPEECRIMAPVAEGGVPLAIAGCISQLGYGQPFHGGQRRDVSQTAQAEEILEVIREQGETLLADVQVQVLPRSRTMDGTATGPVDPHSDQVFVIVSAIRVRPLTATASDEPDTRPQDSSLRQTSHQRSANEPRRRNNR